MAIPSANLKTSELPCVLWERLKTKTWEARSKRKPQNNIFKTNPSIFSPTGRWQAVPFHISALPKSTLSVIQCNKWAKALPVFIYLFGQAQKLSQMQLGGAKKQPLSIFSSSWCLSEETLPDCTNCDNSTWPQEFSDLPHTVTIYLSRN